MKSISKLQFITTNPNDAEGACKGGANWIQLRVKNKTDNEWMDLAKETKKACAKYNATLIINDNVHIAHHVGANGVHLGKDDMSPEKARLILGHDFIIGGTANTFDDIKRLAKSNVDYIGLGPYHYTKTKEKLSPILGIEGYKQLIKYCILEKITLPLIAVGGIKLHDVFGLIKTGVYGVAISSAISSSGNIEKATKEFIDTIEKQFKQNKEHADNWR
ncbi:MAG: thiamine phosphate synthase [Bacteroidia bacterium]|nr:thiamine phosphate synthase [Bacteroidia bacterium]